MREGRRAFARPAHVTYKTYQTYPAYPLFSLFGPAAEKPSPQSTAFSLKRKVLRRPAMGENGAGERKSRPPCLCSPASFK